jgi:hypothetical protein
MKGLIAILLFIATVPVCAQELTYKAALTRAALASAEARRAADPAAIAALTEDEGEAKSLDDAFDYVAFWSGAVELRVESLKEKSDPAQMYALLSEVAQLDDRIDDAFDAVDAVVTKSPDQEGRLAAAMRTLLAADVSVSNARDELARSGEELLRRLGEELEQCRAANEAPKR